MADDLFLILVLWCLQLVVLGLQAFLARNNSKWSDINREWGDALADKQRALDAIEELLKERRRLDDG